MNVETLAHVQKIAADVMAKVTPEQFEAPTPCAEWNVGQLVDHLVGAQRWATAALQGSEMSDSAGVSQGDYLATFDEAATELRDAASAEGALDKMVNPGFGDMPAPALLGLAITDTFTHAWDLATATGQNNDLDPELAAQLLAGARQSIQPAYRSEEGTIFGPEQEAPADAPAASQLAAFLGRTV